jgi:RNA polymerase sigma factor (sigma-70 family)
MNDDAALLRSYAEEGSEDAFTALVGRHVDFVYATALRRVGGDTHLAADVAQQVFATVARQAGKLTGIAVLSAWLHTATRNAAFNLVNAERRRRAREQVALDPAFVEKEAAPEWERLKPVLDAAIDELPAPDREAVVLRFLEQKPFGEIGAALKVSSDAARMRTERALDKLRAALERRGITSTAAAVGAIVSSQPLISAPPGLVSAIGTSTLATAGAGTGALSLAFTALMNLKTFLGGAALLSAFGMGAYFGSMVQLDAPPIPTPATPQHSRTIATLRQENFALRGQIDALRATSSAPSASTEAIAAPPVSPSSSADRQKARAMFNTLQQLARALDQFLLENGRLPESYHDLVGPGKYINAELKPVAGEDYAQISLVPGQPMTVQSPSGISATFNPDGSGSTQPPQETPIQPSRRATRVYGEQGTAPLPSRPPLPPQISELGRRLAPAMQKALDAYIAAHGGSNPPEGEAGYAALIPYFSNPQEGADYVEFLEGWKQAGRK